MPNDPLDRLLDALINAFEDDEDKALTIVRSAGLARGTLPRGKSNQREWWRAAIREAWRQQKLLALVDAAVADPELGDDLRQPFLDLRAAVAEVQTRPAPSDEEPSPERPTPFVVPFLRNTNFVGRKADLDALHAALQAGHATGIRPAGLTGMGGIGKTQLAVEYVFRHRDDYLGGIFWLNAAAPLIQGFATLGRALEPEIAGDSIDVQIRVIADHLRAHSDSLLVLDNVADPAELRRPVFQDLIPAGLPCRVLFTTRQRELGDFTPVEVTVLPPEPALKLLLRARSEALDPAHPEHGAATEIAAILGYLPLALEVAGAHLGKMAGRPIAAYRDELLRRGALPVVDDARGGVRDEDLGTRHTAAVEATLRGQWDALTDGDARLLLRVAGQMPEATVIPAERLGLLAGVSEADGGFFATPLETALKALHDASLVEALAEGQVRPHPLVREFAARLTSAPETPAFRRECAERLSAAYADFATLEGHCARRGVDALEGNLSAALALTGGARDDPPDPELRGLLRVLQRESHVLHGWSPADDPALLAQRVHKRAAQMRMAGLASIAAKRLTSLGRPYFTWRWQAGGDPPELERRLTGRNSYVSAIAVTPDGWGALSGSADGTVIVWDLTTGAADRILRGHSDWVRAVAVTPDGRRALSGSDDGTVIVWDLGTGAAERTLQGHSRRVNAIAVTPDGRRVISGSDDGTVIVWDLTTGAAERTLQGHSDWVNAVAVTPDGRRTLSASADGTVIVWDLTTGAADRTLRGHGNSVNAIAVTPDGRRALSGSYDRTVIVWDLTTGAADRTLRGHSDWVRAVGVTPDGQRALSGSADRAVIVWDLATGAAERILQGHSNWVNAVAATPDGRRALSASDDGTVIVWDLGAGAAARTFQGHSGSVSAIAVTPDGWGALSGSADGTVIVWDLTTGAADRILRGHSDWVRAVAVTPDGRRALSGSDDGTVIVWDLGTGAAERTLQGHSRRVNAIAVTPDGRRALSGSYDRAVIVWDLTTGAADRTLQGHSDWVNAIAATPDDRQAFSGSGDGTVIVWALATGEKLARPALDAPLLCLAIAPDGVTMACGDRAGTVYCLEYHEGSG